MNLTPNYDIVLSQQTLDKIVSYKNALHSKTLQAGAYLKQSLVKRNLPIDQIHQTSDEQFIELLLSTKKPRIFAESEVICDGTDWNNMEFQILGDINIAMKVKIYDNGVWISSNKSFHRHELPLNGTLLFMPGPLIKGMSPDLNEIIDGKEIDQHKYNQLIERRLAPLLHYANEAAKTENTSAFITIPGIGCGAFAGKFRGKMGERLNHALQYILQKHAQKYTNIECIYFDPHMECSNEQYHFGNVKYRVRPAVRNGYKPQLCNPTDYQELGDDFSKCSLFKVVAWDHVSYPGNDFFSDSRNTDDGVSAAATNSMEVVTGISGQYVGDRYEPPDGADDWEEVVFQNDIKLVARNNVKVIDV